MWILLAILVLLVNTHKYWSYAFDITGTAIMIGVLLFLALFIVMIVQVVQIFKERFTNKSRNVLVISMMAVLVITVRWPDGILPGTTPPDKFERLTLQHTGLDLYNYSYDVVTDSIEDVLFCPDFYYTLVVQYDSAQFDEIVDRIQKTAWYDQVGNFDPRKQEKFDSLKIDNPMGVWDNDEQYIWFVTDPKRDLHREREAFRMHFNKANHQACIEIIEI